MSAAVRNKNTKNPKILISRILYCVDGVFAFSAKMQRVKEAKMAKTDADPINSVSGVYIVTSIIIG